MARPKTVRYEEALVVEWMFDIESWWISLFFYGPLEKGLCLVQSISSKILGIAAAKKKCLDASVTMMTVSGKH